MVMEVVLRWLRWVADLTLPTHHFTQHLLTNTSVATNSHLLRWRVEDSSDTTMRHGGGLQ